MTDDQAWGLVILVLGLALMNPRPSETGAGAAFGCLGIIIGTLAAILGVALVTGTVTSA